MNIPKRPRGRPRKGDTSYDDALAEFADDLKEIDSRFDFKQSSRGWCYQLEGMGFVSKGEFDDVQKAINECRKRGLVPLDFVAEEEARQFDVFDDVDEETPEEYLTSWVDHLSDCQWRYDAVSFWESQDCYIEMLVEKIDLKTLFSSVCAEYKIPIASSRGWSSILQRAEMIERFQEWEQRGKQAVLLYCGDFDPAGLQISKFMADNIDELSDATGWTSNHLIIDRFGLNYDFITEMSLSWIENLETGSGQPANEKLQYVRDYIEEYGRRKVEANAIVIRAQEGRQLCRDAIGKYLGDDPFSQYRETIWEYRQKIVSIQNAVEWGDTLRDLKERIEIL